MAEPISRRDQFTMHFVAALIARNGLSGNPVSLSKQVVPFIDALIEELDKPKASK